MDTPIKSLEFDLLPPELKIHIFSQMDIKTLGTCNRTCRSWNSIISDDQGLWKCLCFRDYADYLNTKPLACTNENEEMNHLSQLSSLIRNPILLRLAEELNYERDEQHDSGPEESSMNDSIVLLHEGEIAEDHYGIVSHRAKKPKLEVYDRGTFVWSEYYKECFLKYDLNGIWIGKYGAHGDELVRVIQKGFNLEAWKVTGDPNVPAGKQTWKMVLDREMAIGEGNIHLADHGYTNPRWGQATFKIIDSDHFDITWRYSYMTFPMPFERESTRKLRLEKQESPRPVLHPLIEANESS